MSKRDEAIFDKHIVGYGETVPVIKEDVVEGTMQEATAGRDAEAQDVGDIKVAGYAGEVSVEATVTASAEDVEAPEVSADTARNVFGVTVDEVMNLVKNTKVIGEETVKREERLARTYDEYQRATREISDIELSIPAKEEAYAQDLALIEAFLIAQGTDEEDPEVANPSLKAEEYQQLIDRELVDITADELEAFAVLQTTINDLEPIAGSSTEVAENIASLTQSAKAFATYVRNALKQKRLDTNVSAQEEIRALNDRKAELEARVKEMFSADQDFGLYVERRQAEKEQAETKRQVQILRDTVKQFEQPLMGALISVSKAVKVEFLDTDPESKGGNERGLPLLFERLLVIQSKDPQRFNEIVRDIRNQLKQKVQEKKITEGVIRPKNLRLQARIITDIRRDYRSHLDSTPELQDLEAKSRALVANYNTLLLVIGNPNKKKPAKHK